MRELEEAERAPSTKKVVFQITLGLFAKIYFPVSPWVEEGKTGKKLGICEKDKGKKRASAGLPGPASPPND